jgi:hypothetical protein
MIGRHGRRILKAIQVSCHFIEADQSAADHFS